MADNNNKNPVAEPLQKSAQAAHMVRGAIKVGKAIAGAAKGAAAGGVWGAVAGFAWENRKIIVKIIIASTVILMIPIIILCMLPSVIFGGITDAFSPDNPVTPVINDASAINNNIAEITSVINTVMTESQNETLQAIENDFNSSSADGKEIINPYDGSPSFNSNLFIAQYCASKNVDYMTVSISDMENVIRSGKDKLYSYTKTQEERVVETVSTTVTVDTSTGEEIVTETVTTTTEIWIIYTVVYNGEDYFADEIFYLNDEQKALAHDYANNLEMFQNGGI